MLPILLAVSVSSLSAPGVHGQSGENEIGNWLIHNSTFHLSQKWSVFAEAQLRLWEVASNVNEVFARAAGHYNLSSAALVGMGYMRAATWPFEGNSRKTEDRIYQQFAIKHFWGRTVLEHRYRLEQRWIDTGSETNRSGRARYRFQATAPVNRESLQRGAYFVNVYNEAFIGFDGGVRSFDQNRLYVAGGYQFTSRSNLQLGVLWQARSSTDFFRLQIFYTHNFDLRKK